MQEERISVLKIILIQEFIIQLILEKKLKQVLNKDKNQEKNSF